MPRAFSSGCNWPTCSTQVWDIRTIGFVPKPDPAAYDAVVKAGGITPGKAAMFDDIARNLVVPHELGMTTVWLDCQSDWSRQGPEFPVASDTHIDHETRELGPFPQQHRDLT